MAERYSGADGFANGSARAGGGGFRPDYMESDATGGGFALSYKGRSSTDTHGELGARFDHVVGIYGDAALLLRGRAAWADLRSRLGVRRLRRARSGAHAILSVFFSISCRSRRACCAGQAGLSQTLAKVAGSHRSG